MSKKITSAVVYRLIADVFMVNVCFSVAYFLRLLITLVKTPALVNSFSEVLNYAKADILVFVALSIISAIVFSLSGFYSRNRVYRSRFKALVVLQAVALSYLILGFGLYLLGHSIASSRSVLLIAWGLTSGVMLFSRLWSVIWRKMTLEAAYNNTIKPQVNKKNILIIGGAGYIGSALLPKLLDSGYKVRLLDLFVYGVEPIKDYLDNPNLQIIKADFRQIDKVVEAVRGVSSVVHLGAIVGDPACALDEDLTTEVNLMATKMIAEICKGYGVERFVFASTCSVYGASTEVLSERSKLNPVSLYATSKIACERVLTDMADESFAPVILRFSTIYGFSGRTRFDLVVNLLTAKAHFDGKITLFGGDQWRPFLHVDDAAESVMSVVKAPGRSIYNQVFNVGHNDHNYTLGQVGEIISKIVPNSKVIEMGQDGDRRDYRVDFTKINKILHFQPNWTN
jgi:nucleoside-diphosphate-sugar epimerase